MLELREYQARALDAIRDTVRNGVKRLIVSMPTGAGKTRLAAEIVNGAQSKKKRVIFTIPAKLLVDQTVQAFHDEGITDVGVIQADHHMTDWSKPIQVVSIQTLMRRGRIPEADVVIRDEAHKLFSFDLKWMKMPEWQRIPFIGLSATPWTKGLGRHYETLLTGTTTKELIAAGYLCRFRVFVPFLRPDLAGVKTVAGDYHQEQLGTAVNTEPLVADVVATWKQHAIGRPTVCFAVDCAHARALQKQFDDGGVSAGYMDARTPELERAKIAKQFASGEIEVLCNVDVMGMGVDWPSISCISYCRPTRSEIRFVQNIGRGLRPAPGKEYLLILDHSDTTLRLGFVTDIEHETLDGGREKLVPVRQKPLPKECKACHFLKPPGYAACPNCGHEDKAHGRENVVQNAPGELREYTALPQYKGKAEKFSTMDKRQFYAELLGYALEKGKKPGMAFYMYRDKFHVKPVGMDDVRPITPSTKMRIWIRSRNIAWAMSRKRQGGHELGR